jgi:hypothetical protein
MSAYFTLFIIASSYVLDISARHDRKRTFSDSRETQTAIRGKAETFDAMTPDNDPHGERDLGAFEHNGQRIFWKIDYYDRTLTKGSEDASDPTQTVRVITIMLASEY